MKSRLIIGTVATFLFAKEYITINKIQFQYPYISQTNKINDVINPMEYQFRKNSWILSIRNLQHFSKSFSDVKDNDLVLCENPKGQSVFKIVGAISRSYTPFQNGVSNFIPPGFVFLIDPIRKQIGMENIAIITSKIHVSLGKWQFWKSIYGQPIKKAQKQQQQSFERQILSRNNVRQQIKQSQIYLKQKQDDQS